MSVKGRNCEAMGDGKLGRENGKEREREERRRLTKDDPNDDNISETGERQHGGEHDGPKNLHHWMVKKGRIKVSTGGAATVPETIAAAAGPSSIQVFWWKEMNPMQCGGF